MKLTENELWGLPPSSDGAFLVALRERMSPKPAAPLWLSVRALAGVSALCVLLIAAIWLPGGVNSNMVTGEYLTLDSVLDDADSASIDPDELAAYLGVDFEEESEAGDAEYSVEAIANDELNSLDDTDFNALLAELEQARFF
ncbi:hypothetical protein IT157_08200 [bacterium]|nr:hypothetical protein [bacterium]